MRSYPYRLHHRRQTRWKPIITGLLLLVSLWLGLRLVKALTTTKIISPLSETNTETTTQPNLVTFTSSPDTKNIFSLMTHIKETTDNKSAIYSIYFHNLLNDEVAGFNETTIFTAASVNKLALLATLYHEAQRGDLDLDERITVQAQDIQNFGTGVIQYRGPGQIYSLKTLAQLLIENSDNTANAILSNKIGERRIQELIDSWGLKQTNIKNNKTSNKDMAILLTKMHRGQITKTALTTEMIGFLDNSDFEDRLPRLLPETATVYHKIGTEVAVVHDVGIIKTNNSLYYLGVMTNDVTDIKDTEDTIAQISKMIYDFITSQ